MSAHIKFESHNPDSKPIPRRVEECLEAGGHTCKDLVIPDGIHLEVLPPYSPELKPAERLWRFANEPLVI